MVVMVAGRVGVADKVGAAVRVGPAVPVAVPEGVAVAVVAIGKSVRGVALGVADAAASVGLGVVVGVGVLVRVAVAVEVEVAVAVRDGSGCASLTLSGSVLKLATMSSPKTLMNASRVNTGCQSAIARAACLGVHVAIRVDVREHSVSDSAVSADDAITVDSVSHLPRRGLAGVGRSQKSEIRSRRMLKCGWFQ
jgi:hypothetical protein